MTNHRREQRTISQNALPGNPIPSIREQLKRNRNGEGALSNFFRDRMIKGAFDKGPEKFSISVVELPFGATRISFESVTVSSRRPGVQVDTMSMVVGANGKISFMPKAHRHLQSSHYQPNYIRGVLNGAEAGKANSALLLEKLEAFGGEFLKGIADPEKAERVASALLKVHAVLENPSKTFGPGATQPSLTPDDLNRGSAFMAIANSRLNLNVAGR